MPGGHRSPATWAVLVALGAVPTVAALSFTVRPVSASVVAVPAVVDVSIPVGRPTVETAPRVPITALPSPCTTQARRLAETHQALAQSTGPSSLIEAEDAALIARVLISQCGWSAAETVIGRY